MTFFDQDYSHLKYFKPGQLDILQALVTKQAPKEFWEDSSWDVSDPSFRQLALMYYHQENHKKSKESRLGLELDDTTLVINGDLNIKNNLELYDSGSLIVLGNLTVEGNIWVASDYPALYVSGELHATNLYVSQAEVIVLHKITIANILALMYNHTVFIAPKTRAAVCAMDDAFPDTEILCDTIFTQLGSEFFRATIDTSFKDTHQSEDEYYEMIEEIHSKIKEFFCS